ncbi:MAG TPA: hypothetical protein VK849_00175 [Longimicrobiales bacterium]|nr:hypothetical protein [Longimicrobiales bacterium]
MLSAAMSVLLGALPFMMPVPLASPVIGLAFGANAILKEGRLRRRRLMQRDVGLLGFAISGVATVLISMY